MDDPFLQEQDQLLYQTKMNKVRLPTEVIVVSGVALHKKNGSGARVLSSYLSVFRDTTVVNVFRDWARVTQADFAHQKGAPSLIHVGKGLLGAFCSSLKAVLRRHPGENTVLIVLPDSIRDMVVALPWLVFCPRSTLWMMDDVVGSALHAVGLVKGRCYNFFLNFIVHRVQNFAVISEAMAQSYFKRYGRKADLIITSSWHTDDLKNKRQRSRIASSNTPKKIIYIGSYTSPYIGPLLQLSKIKELERYLTLDLFGYEAPPQDILSPAISYKGAPERGELINLLSSYDMGLLSYSAEEQSQTLMRLSFPSKLIDYLAADLPVLTIAPEGLGFVKQLRERNVGPVFSGTAVTSLDLERIRSLDSNHFHLWSESSKQWFQEQFTFQKNLQHFVSVFFR